MWSNGYILTANNIKETFIYMLKNKTIFVNYLSFIQGVEDYLHNGSCISNVKIEVVQEDLLEIYTEYDYDYKSLLSSIQFAPVYFDDTGEIDANITSGPFIIDEIDKINACIYLSKNKYYSDNCSVEAIKFTLEKDRYKAVELFLDGKADMTSSTFFPFDKIKKLEKHPCFFTSKSNIEFNLIVQNNDLLKIKNNLGFYLIKALNSDCLLNSGIALNRQNYKYKDIDNFRFDRRLITVIYPDYYPNNLIIEKVALFFKDMNILVKEIPLKLDEYIKNVRNNKEQFDIILSLSSPIINSRFEVLLSYLNNIYGDYLNKLNKLNKCVEYNLKEKYINSASEYARKYSNRISIGNVKHMYLKRGILDKLIIDQNDLLRFIGGE